MDGHWLNGQRMPIPGQSNGYPDPLNPWNRSPQMFHQAPDGMPPPMSPRAHVNPRMLPPSYNNAHHTIQRNQMSAFPVQQKQKISRMVQEYAPGPNMIGDFGTPTRFNYHGNNIREMSPLNNMRPPQHNFPNPHGKMDVLTRPENPVQRFQQSPPMQGFGMRHLSQQVRLRPEHQIPARYEHMNASHNPHLRGDITKNVSPLANLNSDDLTELGLTDEGDPTKVVNLFTKELGNVNKHTDLPAKDDSIFNFCTTKADEVFTSPPPISRVINAPPKPHKSSGKAPSRIHKLATDIQSKHSPLNSPTMLLPSHENLTANVSEVWQGLPNTTQDAFSNMPHSDQQQHVVSHSPGEEIVPHQNGQVLSNPCEENIVFMQPGETIADKLSKPKRKRRKCCGECPPCKIKENCGKCYPCVNKGTVNMKCKMRKCIMLKKKDPDSPAVPKVKKAPLPPYALNFINPSLPPEGIQHQPLLNRIQPVMSPPMALPGINNLVKFENFYGNNENFEKLAQSYKDLTQQNYMLKQSQNETSIPISHSPVNQHTFVTPKTLQDTQNLNTVNSYVSNSSRKQYSLSSHDSVQDLENLDVKSSVLNSIANTATPPPEQIKKKKRKKPYVLPGLKGFIPGTLVTTNYLNKHEYEEESESSDSDSVSEDERLKNEEILAGTGVDKDNSKVQCAKVDKQAVLDKNVSQIQAKNGYSLHNSALSGSNNVSKCSNEEATSHQSDETDLLKNTEEINWIGIDSNSEAAKGNMLMNTNEQDAKMLGLDIKEDVELKQEDKNGEYLNRTAIGTSAKVREENASATQVMDDCTKARYLEPRVEQSEVNHGSSAEVNRGSSEVGEESLDVRVESSEDKKGESLDIGAKSSELSGESSEMEVESSGVDSNVLESKEDNSNKNVDNSTDRKIKEELLDHDECDDDVEHIQGVASDLLDRLRSNAKIIPPACNCLGENVLVDEEAEGPYYTHLGAAQSVDGIRKELEMRTGLKGNAIRVEKVVFTGKEGRSPLGCPVAKWIIRRSGPEEKLLCVVRHRKNHYCPTAVIIVCMVAWEGVPQKSADDLYDHLVRVLPTKGFETERRCGTNEPKTCACQGWDQTRRGASFSFGCSWSMYYNGCKYARSRIVRKFKLKEESEEDILGEKFQSLATHVAPLYKTVAPTAYHNQAHFEKNGLECRLGNKPGRPFSGVTACMDFCAHAHRDVHNMNNGCTVLVTLTKHRSFDKPDDEQLHVLPLYKISETDEFGSFEGQQRKLQNGSVEVLNEFKTKIRVRSTPLTPKKKKKGTLGKKGTPGRPMRSPRVGIKSPGFGKGIMMSPSMMSPRSGLSSDSDATPVKRERLNFMSPNMKTNINEMYPRLQSPESPAARMRLPFDMAQHHHRSWPHPGANPRSPVPVQLGHHLQRMAERHPNPAESREAWHRMQAQEMEMPPQRTPPRAVPSQGMQATHGMLPDWQQRMAWQPSAMSTNNSAHSQEMLHHPPSVSSGNPAQQRMENSPSCHNSLQNGPGSQQHGYGSVPASSQDINRSADSRAGKNNLTHSKASENQLSRLENFVEHNAFLKPLAHTQPPTVIKSEVMDNHPEEFGIRRIDQVTGTYLHPNSQKTEKFTSIKIPEGADNLLPKGYMCEELKQLEESSMKATSNTSMYDTPGKDLTSHSKYETNAVLNGFKESPIAQMMKQSVGICHNTGNQMSAAFNLAPFHDAQVNQELNGINPPRPDSLNGINPPRPDSLNGNAWFQQHQGRDTGNQVPDHLRAPPPSTAPVFNGQFVKPDVHRGPGGAAYEQPMGGNPREQQQPAKPNDCMEYETTNEHLFQNQDIGGVSIALSHGAVLFEVAKRELHATTPLKNPNRFHPTRISLVFYQHKRMNYRYHGLFENEKKMEMLRQKRLVAQAMGEDPDTLQAWKMAKKKRKLKAEGLTGLKKIPEYRFMWQAPTRRETTRTTDSVITRWMRPQTIVSGPYQQWT